MSGPGLDARAQAAVQMREHIRRVAVDVFGAVEHEEPVEGFRVLTRTVLDEPLAGVRAARCMAAVAEEQRREWALAARGAGRSWDEVAAALEPVQDEDGVTRGGVAYEWLIEHRPPEPGRLDLHRTVAFWRCTACGAQVRDTGPFDAHPDDRESGHDDACPRRGAELAAWRRELDALEDDNQDEDDGGQW